MCSRKQINYSEEEDDNLFQQHGSTIQNRRDILKNSKVPQQSLTPYEEEFIKQNSKASSSSKSNEDLYI